MTVDLLVPLLVGSVGLGIWLGWFICNRIGQNKILSAEERAKKIIADAETETINLKKEKLLEVKNELLKKKQEFEREQNQKRNKLQTLERQLNLREENLERRIDLLNKKEREISTIKKDLEEQMKSLQEKHNNLQNLIAEENRKLEQVSGMTSEEAKTILINNMVTAAKNDVANIIKSIRDNAKLEAKREAQHIIIQAIQRTAADHCVESTISVLQLENDEIKGRIIGKEGRNIRALEAHTGVDVIVDDTPEAVILSAFDPLRREIAKISLEQLIADGRIHPARIEEVVEKVKREMDEEIIRVAENALIECGLQGIHPELLKYIGIMKYRLSYGQNLLTHSIEVAHLSGLLAVELHLDPILAKRAGFLHDIGKTINRDTEGPHALIGYELLKKYGEHPIVLNSVASHHDDIPMEHPISVLVQSADAISGSRPGARRETIENYAKRLERLENLAKSFDGVAKTYAIQAGREIRVIVECDKVDDAMADMLANDIAEKIQSETEFTRQIKVVVIREKRSIAYTK